MEKYIGQDNGMKAKYILLFLFCVLLLAASEYYFLLELSNQKRTPILVFSSLIALVSIIVIFASYKRLGKED